MRQDFPGKRGVVVRYFPTHNIEEPMRFLRLAHAHSLSLMFVGDGRHRHINEYLPITERLTPEDYQKLLSQIESFRRRPSLVLH